MNNDKRTGSGNFRRSFLSLTLIVACQTSAKPGNSASTPVGSSPTNRCKNVYFSLHAGTPNKKIGTLLQEMKIQLMHVKNDVSIIKARNNTSCKESTETLLREIKETLLEMQNDIASIKENKMLSESRHTCTEVKKNCAELYKSGKTSSGVYTIDPGGHGAFSVFCDQTAAGGGWTVFQKRLDGSVDFYRRWTDYKNGFGNLHGEFWLGLDKIHRLTTTIKNKLRVHLMDTKGKTAYAEYNMLAVASENKYKLSLGTYSGNAGDSLSRHRRQPFATKDKDRYRCAVTYKGAWWYESCHSSKLNGLYHHGAHSSYADGVNWYNWKGCHYSVKKAEMKITPVQV